MPKKVYPAGQPKPYESNEYYKLKMREHLARKRKETLWSVTINDKNYIFKSKKDININKITTKDLDKTKDIICF